MGPTEASIQLAWGDNMSPTGQHWTHRQRQGGPKDQLATCGGTHPLIGPIWGAVYGPVWSATRTLAGAGQASRSPLFLFIAGPNPGPSLDHLRTKAEA
ncbi:hypothetical protein NDU88_004017 [Pleurodeles waltl]|uniref:Uncharacterized protein n=1 Tax=Pleurodeles waltl TaxID=8319 RepID=A0AAV7SHL7_PLEWA|nr:hypothetical protein NDU88_004017 [Pleurodeles waltl]